MAKFRDAALGLARPGCLAFPPERLTRALRRHNRLPSDARHRPKAIAKKPRSPGWARNRPPQPATFNGDEASKRLDRPKTCRLPAIDMPPFLKGERFK